MRVICIDNSDGFHGCASRLLEIGKEYEADQSISANYYDILEVPFDPLDGLAISFLKKRFIPLSEIDERGLAHAEPIESTFTLKEV